MNLFYYGNMNAEQESTGQTAPVISIIVPVTRMAGRLGDLARWLGDTDFGKVEVIIVHDKQDEVTSQDLNSLSTEFPHVVRIEQTFNSAGLARNAGLEVARGRWIAFWDSDDIPNIKTLNTFIQSEKSEKTELFIFNYEVQDKAGNKRGLRSENWQQLAINPGLWRLIFSSAVIKNLRFPNFPLAEDQYLLAQYCPPSRILEYVDQTLYTYKIGHLGQITSDNSKIKQLRISLDALTRVRKNQSRNDYIFTSILFWRQILTILKRGQLTTKIIAVFVGLRSLTTPRFRTYWNLKALTKVISYLVTTHE